MGLLWKLTNGHVLKKYEACFADWKGNRVPGTRYLSYFDKVLGGIRYLSYFGKVRYREVLFLFLYGSHLFWY